MRLPPPSLLPPDPQSSRKRLEFLSSPAPPPAAAAGIVTGGALAASVLPAARNLHWHCLLQRNAPHENRHGLYAATAHTRLTHSASPVERNEAKKQALQSKLNIAGLTQPRQSGLTNRTAFFDGLALERGVELSLSQRRLVLSCLGWKLVHRTNIDRSRKDPGD